MSDIQNVIIKAMTDYFCVHPTVVVEGKGEQNVENILHMQCLFSAIHPHLKNSSLEL